MFKFLNPITIWKWLGKYKYYILGFFLLLTIMRCTSCNKEVKEKVEKYIYEEEYKKMDSLEFEIRLRDSIIYNLQLDKNKLKQSGDKLTKKLSKLDKNKIKRDAQNITNHIDTLPFSSEQIVKYWSNRFRQISISNK
jgi:hypothetical protein